MPGSVLIKLSVDSTPLGCAYYGHMRTMYLTGGYHHLRLYPESLEDKPVVCLHRVIIVADKMSHIQAFEGTMAGAANTGENSMQ